jgi:hypothetical protein
MSTSKRAQFASNIEARVRRKYAVRAGNGFRGLLFVQCLGLTLACAKGEELDTGPVIPISLREASAPVNDSGVGSGGTVVSGSGGAITGSGGATGTGGAKASGGTQGKGAGGGSGGAAPGTGGKAGSGGTASGGAASGGAPASGGAATGGRASGGASGAGGAGTGGNVGTGGGSGGAQNCPGYVDDDACSRCICQKCATQVAACFKSSDATKNDQCKAIQDCAEEKHCASSPCYCNQATNPFCAPPDGPCADPIEAAAGPNPNAIAVQQQSGDSSTPIGRANNIGKCSQSNCKTECQLP